MANTKGSVITTDPTKVIVATAQHITLASAALLFIESHLEAVITTAPLRSSPVTVNLVNTHPKTVPKLSSLRMPTLEMSRVKLKTAGLSVESSS